MEVVGTIGSDNNGAGTILKTKKGNYVDAPSVDGRKTEIKENQDGTYSVNVTKNGKTEYNRTLDENELVKQFGADISQLDINLQGTNSKQQAQTKYGNNVANNLYRVV